MNNNPFEIQPHNLDKTGEELSRVPFGSLIGNILKACVDAQENASNVAWDYTKTVLAHKTPMVFTFMEGKTLKRLEVPLVTIVPLPYMRIDDVNIAFDARVEVDNVRSKQFVVQMNNENTEGKTMQTAKASANLHIDIDAGTTDMPVGLATLLEHMSGGVIVEDVEKPTLPAPAPNRPSSSSGSRPLGQIINNVQNNADSCGVGSAPPTSCIPTSSSSGIHISTELEDAVRFSEEIDTKMRESSEKHAGKEKLAQRSSTTVRSSGSGYKLTVPERLGSDIALRTSSRQYAGEGIRALHVNWTKPSRVREPGKAYSMEDFDLLSTVLSALLWRRFNGNIKLYTDEVGFEYYYKLGLTDLWDGGIDTTVLESIPEDIPADIFWAGAKLFAMRDQTSPFLMMDTDLMVWNDIRGRVKEYDVMAYHRESLTQAGCYIDYKDLKKPKGYRPVASWDWTLDPYNTALTYFNDGQFLRYYTDKAIEFMRGNNERPLELVSQMVFAEQRLFAMCAKQKGIRVGTFLSSPYEDSPDFTHIWGGKDEARSNHSVGNRLCATLAGTITRHFSEVQFSPVMRAILRKYNND